MKVANDNIWLCSDCMLVVMDNDNLEGFNYYYTYDKALERIQEIVAGLDNLPGLVDDFLTDNEDRGIDEFSSRECDCCQSLLAGRRYRFKQLEQS